MAAAPVGRADDAMSGISLLTDVTLVYAAVLVVALATTLITIAVYLWRIARTLKGVRSALGDVRERTSPLAQNLDGLSRLTERRVEEFEHATSDLERAAGVPNEADLLEQEAAKL